MKRRGASLIVALLVVAGMCGALYVRFAPSDPQRWHVSLAAQKEGRFATGVVRILPGQLGQLHHVAQSTPRTKVIAGHPDTGRVTYVTRSAVWGFPDYTTIEQRGNAVVVLARSRFGQSDFGVNATRVEHWGQGLRVLQ